MFCLMSYEAPQLWGGYPKKQILTSLYVLPQKVRKTQGVLWMIKIFYGRTCRLRLFSFRAETSHQWPTERLSRSLDINSVRLHTQFRTYIYTFSFSDPPELKRYNSQYHDLAILGHQLCVASVGDLDDNP